MARAVAYARHPRWTPEEVLTMVGAAANDGLDGRRRVADNLLASAAPVEQSEVRRIHETEV